MKPSGAVLIVSRPDATLPITSQAIHMGWWNIFDCFQRTASFKVELTVFWKRVCVLVSSLKHAFVVLDVAGNQNSLLFYTVGRFDKRLTTCLWHYSVVCMALTNIANSNPCLQLSPIYGSANSPTQYSRLCCGTCCSLETIDFSATEVGRSLVKNGQKQRGQVIRPRPTWKLFGSSYPNLILKSLTVECVEDASPMC